MELAGARILVTGGTGSVGRAVVQRLAQSGAREIRVAARQRPKLPLEGSTSCDVLFTAADVASPDEVDRITAGVDVILHLAAMKDVATCEEYPLEAVRINVVGSANVIAAALKESRVERLLATSSDKACEPTSVLGMTKALMERMVTRASRESRREFGTLRLGNVWGASGSVLARWRETSVRDGYIDVTEPSMTRFLLMPSEAVDAHLAALSRPLAGEVLAPRMRAYRLGDLADAFRLEYQSSSRTIGKRHGEKLHEDLVSADEARRTRAAESMYMIGAEQVDEPVAPVTSADVERLSVDDLRQLLRTS